MEKSMRRRNQLLSLLLSESDYKATDYFSEKLEVSTRTILNDVNFLNKELVKKEIEIVKVPRHGIKLVGIDGKISQIADISVENGVDVYDVLGRREAIFRQLFLNPEGRLLEGLEADFFISDSTLKKDLDYLQRYLRRFEVKICQSKRKVALKGAEADIQQSYQNFLMTKFPDTLLVNNDELLIQLSNYFPETRIQLVKDTLEKFSDMFYSDISDKYFSAIFLTFLCLLTRADKGCHMTIEEKKKNELEDLALYTQTYEICAFISANSSIELWYPDIYHLSETLYAMNVKPYYKSAKQYSDCYQEAVEELMADLGNLLNIDFSGDQELHDSLMTHIVPMIYRLRRNILIKNPFMEEIKNRYLLLYSMMCYATSSIAQRFSIEITGDEISFLVIYFQVSLERKYGVSFRNIYVVLSRGLITGDLIYTKIRRIIPHTDKVIQMTTKDFAQVTLNSRDVVVTTDTSLKAKNVVYISPMIKDEEISRIVHTYYKRYNATAKEKAQVQNQWINPELIFLQQHVENKEECLNFMIQQYQKLGIAKKNFGESVWVREKLGDTSFSVSVAIPHADPSEVNQTSIGIMTLDKKINWGINNVNVILFFAISDTDIDAAKSKITGLLEFIEKEENVEKLIQVTDKQTLLDLVMGEGSAI
ncbi:PTS sugar transporter subunit IIA [Enterococcus gilvus]|uniref:BglG family transcription antiterminator n=1 Tax=Enterococcus gilvus TaxID=160453 RepID=UPI001C8B1A04|nr:PTS sugar transporter subunit IIA [Enterococcus gilvus]MBX8935737.1 BglG family transcription antiterminator [Enterococcus gilvus]